MRGFLSCHSRNHRHGSWGPAVPDDVPYHGTSSDDDDDPSDDDDTISDDDDVPSSDISEDNEGNNSIARNNNNQRYGIDVERQMILTEEDILFFGLTYIGFGEERQQVRDSLNVQRFKAHFGPEPITVKDLLLDLKEDFGSGIIYKDVMMAMNWLKLCKKFILHFTLHMLSFFHSLFILFILVSWLDEVEHVLAGRWKYGEDYIRSVVQDNTRKIQSLKPKVILFAGFDDQEIHVVSVDCSSYDTEEFRLEPSTKWYNHKSNSAGLKYEYAVALRRVSKRESSEHYFPNPNNSTQINSILTSAFSVRTCVDAWSSASWGSSR